VYLASFEKLLRVLTRNQNVTKPTYDPHSTKNMAKSAASVRSGGERGVLCLLFFLLSPNIAKKVFEGKE